MKNRKKVVIRRSIPTVLSAVLFSASVLMTAPVSAAEPEPSASAMDSILDEAIQQGSERTRSFMETGNPSFLQDTSYFNPDEAEARSQAEGLPERYDLRDPAINRVTPVKFQNPFGTCWGFAVIAAAESSILSKYAAYGQTLDPAALDLSEKHLAYFSAHALPEDDDSGQGGEGSYAGIDTNNGYDTGGFAYYGTTAFASGVGPRSEQEFPYEPKDPENHIDYVGEERLCYSADGDWSLDEEDRFGIVYELEESSLLPSPADRELVDGVEVYRYNEAGTNAIKSELMNGRAVSIAFYADTSMPGEELTAEYINPETWAHYTYDPSKNSDHAVTIVGWDDTYDPSNFLEGHQPKQPGAWIVKNSWGAQSNEFPHKNDWGNDGYFYISYYDCSLSEPETFDFFIEDTGHDQVYVNQYDYMTSAFFDVHDTSGKTSEANVFCAEDGDMTLRSVAATTFQAGAKITYDIYRLRDGYTSPTDGICEHTMTETYPYAGYHRKDLDKELHFRQGENYSVVVTQESDGRYLYGAAFGLSKAWWESLPEEERAQRNYSVGVINKGESFLGSQDASGEYDWMDWRDFAAGYISAADNWIATFDNFSIKTYSDPYTFPPKTNLSDATVTLSETAYTYDGKAKTPGVAVAVGEKALTEGQDYTVRYQNNMRAGTATVTVTAKDDSDYTGVQEIDFTINKADLSAATVALSSKTYTYNGRAKTPGVTVKAAGKTLVNGKDYTVSYKKNKNAGKAAVTVTARNDSDYAGAKTTNFTINKAAQTLKLNVSKKNYKAKNLKVKKAAFKIKPSKNKTSVSYKFTKGASRYITVSKKGVVTLKKGSKKGSYKVTMTAKASANYKSAKKTVTIIVK